MKPVRNFLMSFVYAAAGVRVMLRQRNPRIHVLAAVVAVAMGAWLKIDRLEWAVIVLTIAAVMAAEAVNTSIEAMVDLLSPERQPSAKTAKDVAAAAVLLLAIGAAVVGLLIFGPRLWEMISSR